MKNYLTKLQTLQTEAWEKGIHSFEITAREHEGDKFIVVTIFIKGDSTDGDYVTAYFYSFSDWEHELRRITDIVENL